MVVVVVVAIVVILVVVSTVVVAFVVVVQVDKRKNLEQMEINHDHVIAKNHMIMVDFHLL